MIYIIKKKISSNVISKLKMCRSFFSKGHLSRWFWGNHFNINGPNSAIKSAKNCYFMNSTILINGRNNTVIFEENGVYKGLHIFISGDNNFVRFGKGTIVNASKVQPTVINACYGTEINIGEGCLFSNNIEIHTTDYHKIYNKNHVLLNPNKNIIIGKKVWIGLGCKVLKGTQIADGCVIGAGSVLSGKYMDNNTVYVGNPALKVNTEIYWEN